jgi:phosphoribosylanthranilate isomerase
MSSSRVRVKICGVLCAEDALAAVHAGADLIGLNFVPESPRFLEIPRAREIAEALEGSGTRRVALFRNAQPGEVQRVLDEVPVEILQFHGDEIQANIAGFDIPVIKALRGADKSAAAAFPETLLLLDHPVKSGGGGEGWDWSLAAELIRAGREIILAGGLDPENVGEALTALGGILPWGVDVATGVEGTAHRKDPAKMVDFVRAVRAVERNEASEAEEVKC